MAEATFPEPMLRYACNQQGCCCHGWRIPFKPRDLVRLGRYLPSSELSAGLDTRYETSEAGEQVVRDVSLLDEAGGCRFLDASHKGCTVHAAHGIDALPDICVDFPVASYAIHTAVRFFFDPVCPSVLDQLAESDEPVDLTTHSSQDAAFMRRVEHLHALPALRVGAIELSPEHFGAISVEILASLRTGPVMDHLHAIDSAYGDLARGLPFTLRSDRPPDAYRRFFRNLLGQHGAGTLESVFHAYRRFLFVLPRDTPAWSVLGKHLRAWEPAMEQWVTPAEQSVEPLIRRYVAHRHFSPFLTIGGALHFAPGMVVHMVATAYRFAAAFGAALRRPVDRPIMLAALGTSEYVYRSLEIQPSSLPWYGVSN